MTDRDALAALRRLSSRLGADPLLIQGAGGNTSLKIGNILWVKASGKWLVAAEREEMFVPIRFEAARARLAAGEADPTTPEVVREACPPGLRPSIEAAFHALLPHRCVVHVHCIWTLAWAVRTDATTRLAALLDGLDWVFVPYVRPGVPLAQAMAHIMEGAMAASGTPPDVFVLGNHGLNVAAETEADAEVLLRAVMDRLETAPRAVAAADAAGLDRLGAAHGYRLPRHADSHAVALDPIGGDRVTAGSLYPDHLVFLGPGLRSIEAADADSFAAEIADRPQAIAVRGHGVLMRDDSSVGAEEMMRCLSLLAPRLPEDAPIRYLDRAEEAEILGWDAEKFRSGLDRAMTAP